MSPGEATTVLVVEDEPAVRELVCEILTRADYQVLKARNADAALEIARDADRVIDVVLTDLVMPGISGVELVKRLREQRPDIKVILMSGYSQEAVQGEAERGTRLLEKPFNAGTLLERVRELVEAPADLEDTPEEDIPEPDHSESF